MGLSINPGTGNGGIIISISDTRVSRRKSSSRSNKKKRFSSGRYHRRKSYRHIKGRRYTPHTAGKRKDTSRRRIRYTVRGQPYVIGPHGKARFISLKSAKISRKRTGGRY